MIGYDDEDLQTAIGTCVLEHLLEHHFDAYISKMEEAVLADRHFAGAASRCGKFGQSEIRRAAERAETELGSTRRREAAISGRESGMVNQSDD